MREPFILLDDARSEGGSDARLYRAPKELITAHRPDEVSPALERIDVLARQGLHMAGYLAYEAGLALEPRLSSLAEARCGADGPLVWFGAFERYEAIPAADVPHWLAAQADCRPAGIGPLDPALSPGAYSKVFARLQSAISAGDIYQVNLTFPLAGSWQGDPVDLYAAIRPMGRAGYGGLIFDGTHWTLSFSPELFFALKDGAVTVRPMKGTRPRGRDAAEDAALIHELANSAKDRSENLMIVDLMRNDLSRVAEAGSVRVENAFAVETYPTVHQMVSTVRARLTPGKGAVDLLRALFPCGSITGAPKIRAMELIHEAEGSARGPYCGAIGRIDPSAGAPDRRIPAGDAAFNVAIRTLRLTSEAGNAGSARRGSAVLGVGSAIVADSAAMAEWRECLVKGGFVRQSSPEDRSGPDRQSGAPRWAPAASFDLIETMAFSPDEGIPLLEGHLARLGASALELGFAFDRHAIKNAIQALCFDADSPSKLRLMLARSGAISLELSELPAAFAAPVRCGVMPLPVDPGDWRLRHKSSDRAFYETGLTAARAAGADEALFLRDGGFVTEGSFTNLFVERSGVLLTPPLDQGLLPGVLRASLVGAGRACEASLTLDDLAGGFLVGNALRGLMPAVLLT
jgi:para-aminobenzoate synthetase/4-amino-4-deoxychorismate lyase